jgi:hypothetical protein
MPMYCKILSFGIYLATLATAAALSIYMGALGSLKLSSINSERQNTTLSTLSLNPHHLQRKEESAIAPASPPPQRGILPRHPHKFPLAKTFAAQHQTAERWVLVEACLQVEFLHLVMHAGCDGYLLAPTGDLDSQSSAPNIAYWDPQIGYPQSNPPPIRVLHQLSQGVAEAGTPCPHDTASGQRHERHYAYVAIAMATLCDKLNRWVRYS